ncbi:MAG: SIMPL domain-containing protein [Neomegalonema sp.]|nr:SIMPL domain-containing protein [Neomegalonema sp.]
MQNVKMISKWLGCGFLVLALLGCGEEPLMSELHKTISVSGEAKVSAVPDMARMRVGVSSTAQTAREAMALNAERMSGVFEKFAGLGLNPEKDVQTSHVSLHPRWRTETDGQGNRRQVLDGYEASNTITVTIRDIAKIGDTLDALIEAGLNEAGGLSFEISEPEPLLDQARALAIADARRKADLYAKAAGVRVGAVLSISEAGLSAPSPVYKEADRMMMSRSATPIAPGEQDLSAQVTVHWLLEDE